MKGMNSIFLLEVVLLIPDISIKLIPKHLLWHLISDLYDQNGFTPGIRNIKCFKSFYSSYIHPWYRIEKYNKGPFEEYTVLIRAG